MIACAMRVPLFRSVPRRRFAWLLWFALLLPIAQAAATWHALSHTRAEWGDVRGKQLLHEGHCDLCLIATALSGAALPGEPPSSPHPVGRYEPPQTAPSSGWIALPARAYRSRAPPLVLH